jgi:hypothetical protein
MPANVYIFSLRLFQQFSDSLKMVALSQCPEVNECRLFSIATIPNRQKWKMPDVFLWQTPRRSSMNAHILKTLIITFLLGSNLALADNGKVTILSPMDGAMVESTDKTELEYEATPGPDGDHLHLNVDGKRVDVIHQLAGTVMVDALPPGKHQICLAVNTKSHVPTGVEECINVTSH